MDESWRMRMGGHPARRSIGNSSESIFTEDFSDVFGGPPRTALLRKLSGDFTHSTSFYDEIFQPPVFGYPARAKSGRSLPAFKIPTRSDGFYGDVFGSGEADDRVARSRSRSGSRSKTDSSSVLSLEEMSPFRVISGDDARLSSFASKLRPLNVPGRWKSSTDEYEDRKDYGMPVFQDNSPSFNENQFAANKYNEKTRSFHYGYSAPMASPEAISVDPDSYGNLKMSIDDLETNSPSSVVSSLCMDSEAKSVFQDPLPEEDVDDDVESSIVIEISSYPRDTSSEAVSVEEAIAWAKEKFQMHSSAEISSREHVKQHPVETEETPSGCRVLDGHCLELSREEQITWTSEDGMQGSDEDLLQAQLKMLEEEIELWSAGKETNIRFLLSALDNVLWPKSGWIPIPLASLMTSKQVKKAYQKARLCLHPDKLQQRGATSLQKYIADKVFLILQDAWAAFISQDLLFE